MEVMLFDKEKSIQQALATGKDEIVQLKATVSALRQELETLRFEKEDSVQ